MDETCEILELQGVNTDSIIECYEPRAMFSEAIARKIDGDKQKPIKTYTPKLFPEHLLMTAVVVSILTAFFSRFVSM